MLGQITGVALLGSLWAARVATATGGVSTVPPTDAPAAAQVVGLHDTFTVATLMMVVAVGLGVWGLRRERSGHSAPRDADV